MSVHSEDASSLRTDLEKRAIEQVLQGAEWSTAVEIGARRAPGAANSHGTISRWRDAGAVFGIDHGGRKIYPAYVFDASLQPLPAVRKVLEVLKGCEPFRIAAWFESTNAFLGGRRPREVIGTDPDAVVAAAREHAMGPVHGQCYAFYPRRPAPFNRHRGAWVVEVLDDMGAGIAPGSI